MKVSVLVLLVCICKHGSSLNLPGPRVYVVTPSPRPPGVGDARASPFYYNWMRRMDPPQNFTTTTTTQTPDLIFAEFESGNQMKSIRKLLEREKITPSTTTTTTTTTTPRPIYVPESNDVTYMAPVKHGETNKEETKPVDMTDYFALYNNLYNPNSEAQAPIYMPSTTLSTTRATTTTTTTTPSPGPGVENIWHIIDSQKQEQYSPGQWEEEPIGSEDTTTSAPQVEEDSKNEDAPQEIDDNFALPGFATNPVNGAENESRAIRTEPNMRFPYINLKPFQVKTQKMPLGNTFSNSKKSNLYTNLDNFQSLKNPTRGEAQDVMMREPIDRYNPAQPYLPDYGSKSKPSAPASPPNTAVASLVPPPPPPPPKISDGNFPAPASYESFPPYAPSAPATPAPAPAPAPTPSISFQAPVGSSYDSGSDSLPSDSYSDGSPMDLGYGYKPPSAPVQPFLPTYPTASKPSGYTYDKPKSKPFAGYSYDKPFMLDNSPSPSSDDKPSFGGYHYSKPESPPSDLDSPPQSDMKPDMDHGPPADDHGFPHDFPGDLKYHDFDHHHHHDHDHDVYYFQEPTTTTTTEMPRVNRYSYYYLGKKLYYLPLYFSVYFIVYVGALIIKAVLRHKIVYPNSWRPNDQTAGFFSKRSVGSWDMSNENLHEITGKVTHAIAVAGEKYFADKKKQ